MAEFSTKALYTAEDLETLAHQNTLPGAPPYIRGPHTSMYTGRPWTIRQYAGFSTAADSNAFYRDNLAAGQKGLSVAFDLATHRGFDSDHPRVAGDVGMAGFAIDTVKDMKILFDGIPLDEMSVSMTMNGAVLPVLASFAARLLWAELMQQFKPQNPRSSMLRTHCQTSGVSLTAADPYNNIIRTTIEGLAAVLGGTQSLHTNSFDEALSLPTPFSARLARNTQLILAEETGITDVIDPLGGSYYIEHLTQSIAAAARTLIADTEKRGGMVAAIEEGWPQRQVTEAATHKQARLDRGDDVIVGVNKYQTETAENIGTLEINNNNIRQHQIERLKQTRASRDEQAFQNAIDALQKAERPQKLEHPQKSEHNGEHNLLSRTIDAMRARATVGEVTAALEDVFLLHQAPNITVSGVYSAAFGNISGLEAVREEISIFTADAGGPPRMLVVKLGQDGHDRGAKVIATAFADLGFEVELGPLFQSPEEAAQDAVNTKVHIIGVSTHAGGHTTLILQLIAALKALVAHDILVVGGGVIPEQDRKTLLEDGVTAIFGSGTPIPEAASDIVRAIRHKRGLAAHK